MLVKWTNTRTHRPRTIIILLHWINVHAKALQKLKVPGAILCKISRKSWSLTQLLSITAGKQWNKALKFDFIAYFRIQRTPTYRRSCKHIKKYLRYLTVCVLFLSTKDGRKVIRSQSQITNSSIKDLLYLTRLSRNTGRNHRFHYNTELSSHMWK